MSRYIAFDVETPNYQNDRMSAIGITVIEDGIIVDEYYSLVDPETHFDYFNTQLTGISGETVQGEPTFPEVWQEIEPIMSSGLLIAHNAVFDLSVLKKCLRDYDIGWKPYVRYVCTVQTGRRILPGISHKLNDMCEYYGIELDHHQAASDSRACAEILLRYLEDGAATPASTVSPRLFSAVNVGNFTGASTGTTEAASPSSGAAAHGLRPPATPATAERSMKHFWSSWSSTPSTGCSAGRMISFKH